MADSTGPFGVSRPLGLGPFAQRDTADSDSPPDWTELDNDTLAAPSSWSWTVDDELAHHVWQLTAKSRFVGFGPDPPILLEALMGFFPDMKASDSRNNTYLTRKKDEIYSDPETWWTVGTKFQQPSGTADTSSVLLDEDMSPHPLRTKLHSQQYTTRGAMFTYEFTQYQGRETSGFMRIPMREQFLGSLRSELENRPFEEFQMQQREYRDDFADGFAPPDTFAHPHIRADSSATKGDYKQLFDMAFDFMERSTRSL